MQDIINILPFSDNNDLKKFKGTININKSLFNFKTQTVHLRSN